MSQAQYAGTGRRKNAVARVRLVPGTGKITVNKKDVEEYIPHADLLLVINQPVAVTSNIVLLISTGHNFKIRSKANPCKMIAITCLIYPTATDL